ncbi:MAG: beta-ketoacyl synthase N-terminal-like domain-containing protein, partial [Gemmatimonadota bacterium]|nr:beta-ketoacyl synthase N-terminal-like domain-containing protein [Gemmatimonadota bacterium]
MNEPRNGIAVVGMSCIFPGAGDLHAFERNLAAGVDAITEAPDERIPPEFYDPDSDEIDRVYCRRGGFIDEHARFDPVEWGLMPVAARGSEPDQLLTLRVAGGALADAGYDGRAFSRESTGVILGRGGYLNPRMLSLTQAVRTSHELAVSLQRSVPGVSPETVDEVRRDYRSRIEGLGPDTIIGVTPNLAASRVANRLDLKGPAYTVDAACASSLIAVDQARMELLAGRMDMVLVGGVHVCHDPGFWSVFCQIGALSREQRIRPFHREADGLLMGEGVGVVVLKRLADAIADDDRIYAVLRGSGTSSDGRASSVLSPRSESQALAIERAWREARLDPAEPGSVGLIEAHGTATPAGDATELETLARVFGPPVEGPAPGLGSVKSMIGHAMPAAGIAGFIKAVLALHNRRLYPTLHCEEPNPAIGDTRFRIVTETEAWEADGSPRRAGVNAFGFGGVNAHVILEEPPRPPRARRSTVRETETVLLAAASTPAALVEAVEAGRSPDGGACRLAVVDPTPERMEEALAVARRGEPFRDRRGHVWFSPRGLASSGGEIAFLFPGIEGRVHGSLDDVAERFDKPRLRQADRSAAELEETSFQLVWAHRLFHEVLTEAGIRPAALAGHSLGEWSAMLAGGAIGQGTLERLFDTLHPGTMTIPGLAFAAAGVGAEEALARLEGVPDVHVSHDNCPHQSVLCGPAEQIDEAIAQLRDGGVLCQRLSFQSGFHTPHFERHVESIRPVIRDLPLEVPETSVWSATTARRFPDDEERIRELMLEHLLRPVRFRELVEALHRSGIRGFVQIGLGSLIGFVDDTLKDRPHFALPSYDPRRGGLAQLRRLAAALWVEGVEFDVSALVDRVVDRIPGPDRGNEGPRLVLSAPYVYARHPIDPGETPAEPLPPEARSDPVLGRFLETQEMLEESRRRVLQAWREARETTAPRRSSTTRRLSLEEQPYLVDHSFFDLPDGWPHPTDGFPLVPLTMSISMMIDAARDLVPGRIVTGVEDVRAYRWIAVEEPVDVVIEAEYDGASRVETLVRDADEGTAYAKCTVRIADLYDPAPPAGALDDAEERPPPMTATEMYESRHMFHGPAYRSVTDLDAISDETIRGRITRLPAEGSLLDAAGQLLGLWITRMAEDNQVSVPVIVDRVAFHGPEPDVGVELDCTVRVRHFGARQVRSDMEIAAGGQVWAEITGWQDRRTETEGWMWPMILSADEHTLARPHPDLPDGCWTPEPVDRPSAMEYFARRYLDGEEIETYRSLGPRRKAGWLNGRIAAKDAVRRWHWERGGGPTYPIEVRIDGGGDRPPEVRFDPVPDLRLSIAHKGPVAAATVAEGRAVGLDLERIEPRHEGFDEVAFGAPERDLLPAGGGRDEWRARFWAAKEALAKMRGTG